MEENKENAKQLAKAGIKMWMKTAMAPVIAAVSSALLTVLPYILIGTLVFIVIFCVYFGTLDQIDQVSEASQNLGERMGNAFSLYGFRTNEEVDQDEEDKYFKMLSMYQGVFGFSNYDLSILNQTLLYEGSNESRIYLSEKENGQYNITYETSDKRDDEDDTNDNTEKPGFRFTDFLKNILTNFQNGFLSTYAGQSQYLKGNKNLFLSAVALKKCDLLTGGNDDAKEQCYKGYLVAEYHIIVDYLIDCPKYGGSCPYSIETDVEPGFLVLPNNLIGKAIADNLETSEGLSKFFDIELSILNIFSTFTIYKPILKIIGGINQVNSNLKEALTLFIFGVLADGSTQHFYYDGYITKHLREEYKVMKNDEYDSIDNSSVLKTKLQKYSFDELIANAFNREIILEERKNRRETANTILDLVDTYFELTYGYKKGPNKNKPGKGSGGVAYGTSCKPIPDEDLKFFGSPTSGCSVNSCFGVYGGAGDWTCKPHKGIDVNAAGGIHSVCDGTVSRVGMYNDGSASAIEVQCNINGKTYTVRYLHMPMSYVNNWNVGDHVSVGTYLGEQGAVGKGVTGPHLHLDISENGKYVNPESLVSSCNFNLNCENSRGVCKSGGLSYCTE